ncbi:MAG: DUF5343 domain-containing protein [Anaerolineales bacterium]|nr:DUF5343 domain-containing protein [Anaerolineales bacterium]
MADYAYTYVPGKLKEFFGKLRTLGVPNKVTTKWMESIGYKSSNDRSMVGVLQQIQFIDASNAPTERWVNFRGANYRQVLADGIINGYAELFSTYPDAYARSNEELESFFSTKSTAGKQVILKTVSTFKALCELADFSSVSTSAPANASSTATDVSNLRMPPQQDERAQESLPFVPTLHIDIQIHISPDATPQQIEQIFESMAKHIYRIKE